MGLREAAEAAAVAKQERRVADNNRCVEYRRKLGAVTTEAQETVDRAQHVLNSETMTDDEREAGPSEIDHLCCVKGFV